MIDMLREEARPRRLARDEHLLRAGDPATSIAVVVEGLLREYFPLADGTERTKAFILESQLSGSLADLLRGGRSTASIVAEEPTSVLLVPFATFAARADSEHAWGTLARRATEALLLRKADREYALLALDADARYSRFQRDYPGLESRIRARHIASYLGITAVHLSRLRRKRQKA